MDVFKNRLTFTQHSSIGIFFFENENPLMFIHNDVLDLYNSVRTDNKIATLVSNDFIEVVLKYTTYNLSDGDLLFKLNDNCEAIIIDSQLLKEDYIDENNISKG